MVGYKILYQLAMAMHNMKRIPLINQKAYLIMLFLRLKPI